MWLYDGLPEHIGLSVRDATPIEGGYVVVFELENKEIRMLATRFPAKYVSSWRSQTKRHNGEELTRVLVSPPHPRYEKLKRTLAEALADDTEGGAHVRPTIGMVKEKAKALFKIKPIAAQTGVLTVVPPKRAARIKMVEAGSGS